MRLLCFIIIFNFSVSYLLFSHGGISMLTIPVKKLQLHALFKLNTSFLPQLQQFQLLRLQTCKLQNRSQTLKFLTKTCLKINQCSSTSLVVSLALESSATLTNPSKTLHGSNLQISKKFYSHHYHGFIGIHTHCSNGKQH